MALADLQALVWNGVAEESCTKQPAQSAPPSAIRTTLGPVPIALELRKLRTHAAVRSPLTCQCFESEHSGKGWSRICSMNGGHPSGSHITPGALAVRKG